MNLRLAVDREPRVDQPAGVEGNRVYVTAGVLIGIAPLNRALGGSVRGARGDRKVCPKGVVRILGIVVVEDLRSVGAEAWIERPVVELDFRRAVMRQLAGN